MEKYISNQFSINISVDSGSHSPTFSIYLLFEAFLPSWHHKLLKATRHFCKNSKKATISSYVVSAVQLFVVAFITGSAGCYGRGIDLSGLHQRLLIMPLVSTTITFLLVILLPNQPSVHFLKYAHKIFLSSTVLGIMINLMWLCSFFMCYF